MIINSKYKIEKAVSKDETRDSLSQPTFERTGKTTGVLVATDGRILAKVPVKVAPTDVEGYVPIEAIQLTRKNTHYAPLTLDKGGAHIQQRNGAKTTYLRMEGTFPNWKQLRPTAKKVTTITFSPKRLLDLARALGVENDGSLTLKIRKPGDAIEVINGDADGLLMPMKTA